MSEPIALIVDDERDIRELLSLALGRMNIRVEAVETLRHALTLLGEKHFDLCLTDMRLPDGNGLDLIKHVAEHHHHMPIAMITAYGDVQSAVNALKAGAFDFVSKPVELGTLRNLVQQALSLREQRQHPALALIGESPDVQSLRDQIERIARSQAPVLITGEPGVGKAVVARQIHNRSPRANAPFVELHCSAMTADQLEAELFGKTGAFMAADGGTLFLEDIDSLPLTIQTKIHKAVSDRSIRTIGAFADSAVDVRLISSTSKDLETEVTARRFRHELLYRINVISLTIAPLRQRTEDILPLTRDFLGKHAERAGCPGIQLSPEAETALMAYAFPGNVRELESLLERAMALSDGKCIETGDLHFVKAEKTSVDANQTNQALPEVIEKLERAQIQSALEACRYNKTKAAAQLGITFRALRYKMDKLGME
jgi:two-component system response regulator PilR (NtrC family)